MIYQIYYNEETKKRNWPMFAQYDNSQSLTPFFENTVIYDLLQAGKHQYGPYFGVLSPAFAEKARGKMTLNPENLGKKLAENPVFLGFNAAHKSINPIESGRHFHGPAFWSIFQELFGADFRWPLRYQHVIFSNYVIAKPEIWERYRLFYVPLYEKMRDAEGELKNLLWMNSRYNKRLPQSAREQIGADYYPMHTFICERFWTIFLYLNPDIPVIHY